MMNLVHLNASDRQGGAALAVHRLHQALQARGVASRMLVEDRRTPDDSVETIPLPDFVDSLANQHREMIQNVYRDRNRTAVSNTHFSLPLVGHDLSDHPALRSADLIHLHWIASLQTPASLHQLLHLHKPIVWTMHDLGPFTGGCHFPSGCSEFQRSCATCPQLRSDPFGLPAAVLRDKRQLWPADAFTLVAPSRWMADQVRRSALFGAVPRLAVIPNGVDTQVFRPAPRLEARAALGLPLAGTYLLCGADQGQENRKGFGPLGRVLDRCIHDQRFQAAQGRILHLGELPLDWARMTWPLIPLGRVAEEARVALAYAAADLFVLPSLEDNLPNMMLEALSCGTPVVAFAVGGVPEVVQDGQTGRIVPLGDEDALMEAILSLMADPEQRISLGLQGRALIQERYSSAIQADVHLALYLEVLAQAARRGSRLDLLKTSGRDPQTPGPSVASILPRLTAHCLYEDWRSLREETRRLRDEVRSLHEELRGSVADRVARGEVIEGLLTQLHRFEAECADRLRVIEALDALQQRQKAELLAQAREYERRLGPLRRLGRTLRCWYRRRSA